MAIYLGDKKVVLMINGQRWKVATESPKYEGVVMLDKNNSQLKDSNGITLTLKKEDE